MIEAERAGRDPGGAREIAAASWSAVALYRFRGAGARIQSARGLAHSKTLRVCLRVSMDGIMIGI
jgi:hypothetical protein